MEKVIACCGMDCAGCDARIATLADDDALRAKTAADWKTRYNIPDIAISMINCTGCREAGVKISHCLECEIRDCVSAKGYQTCADCDQLESCQIVSTVHQFVPDALGNLKSLRL